AGISVGVGVVLDVAAGAGHTPWLAAHADDAGSGVHADVPADLLRTPLLEHEHARVAGSNLRIDAAGCARDRVGLFASPARRRSLDSQRRTAAGVGSRLEMT